MPTSEIKMCRNTYIDSEFGQIYLRYDYRAIRYIFRVKSGQLHVTLPLGTTESELQHVLEKKREALRRLILRVPDNTLNIGSIVETRCFDININTYRGDKLLYSMKNKVLDVFVPNDADMSNSILAARIKKGVMRIVRQYAAPYLKNRLDSVSLRNKLEYNTFSVSSGRRILGKCDMQRNIKLSCYLMFYPEELIDYVICHELAHLSVMNHGAAFHRLCDKYCGGREAELRKRLRCFPVPF